METTNSEEVLEEVKKFFFKAMLSGWAAAEKKITLSEMPGYKAISFQQGDYKLLDCWCKNANSFRSAGTTTIWRGKAPVWFMSYGGYYEEDSVKYLKIALYNTYCALIFCGGRGLTDSYENKVWYLNCPERNDFSRFNGREELYCLERKKLLGWHEYWGMSLV